MAMFNIFQPKKKQPLSSHASVAPQKSVYSSSVSQNPISAFGSSLSSGGGTKAIQNVFSTPKPQINASRAPIQAPRTAVTLPPTANKSVMTNRSTAPIPASGMSSRFAENPTNYKPKPITTVTPPPAADTVPTFDPTQDFLSRIQGRSAEKEAFINAQRQQQEENIKSRYGIANESIKGQLPGAQENFNIFKQNTLAGVDDIKASGERQKDSTSDYYGEAQRLSAKTLNETKARDQRTFANLNTLDSYGEGSFGQANENSTSDFNRFTQQNLKEKAGKLAEIDQTVGQAERQATTIIAQEETKLKDLERQIQLALMTNDQQMAEELTGSYAQGQQLIFDLKDAVDNLKYSAEMEKYQMQLQNQPQGLSEGFMTTGTPETEKDFIYRTQNPSAFGKFGASNAPKPTEKGQMFSLASQSAQQALDLLNSGIAGSGKGQVIGSAFGRTFDQSSQSQTDYESKLAAARGVALSALSGANVPKEEYARIADMIPVLADEPNRAKQKLQSFVEIMNMYGQNMTQSTTDDLSQEQIQSILSNL